MNVVVRGCGDAANTERESCTTGHIPVLLLELPELKSIPFHSPRSDKCPLRKNKVAPSTFSTFYFHFSDIYIYISSSTLSPIDFEEL